jgi:hypothetical protein
VRRIALGGVLVTALVAAVSCAAPAEALTPRIALETPRAYQTAQRDGDGLGSILVSGRRLGFPGPVEIRWGSGAWVTAHCSGDGQFSLRLRALPAGQATLFVRSALRHDVVVRRPSVGIGDIYIVAGQSNACGLGITMNRYVHATLKACLFGNDDRWRELKDPTDSASGQVDAVSADQHAAGSVWPLLATELMAAGDVPVAFVPCARGSTLLSQWERDDARPGSPVTLYGSMLRRIRAVGGRVRAVLFWQGEADARWLTQRAVYAAQLERLAATLRDDCGAPLIAAQMGDYREDLWSAAGVDAIRSAMQDAWSASAALPGPALYDVDLGGGVHFRTPEQFAIAAHRWAAAILRGALGTEVASPPSLAAAVYDGDVTVTLTFAAQGAPLRAGPVGGIAVRADGDPVAVTAASVTGADSVTVTLAAPVAGRVTVSLGSGRDGAGVAVPVQDSSWALPALPFLDAPVETTLP